VVTTCVASYCLI